MEPEKRKIALAAAPPTGRLHERYGRCPRGARATATASHAATLLPPHIHLLAPPQVHLKYVAASALCSVCAYHAGPDSERIIPLRSLLVYSAATYGLFAGLFVARVGMGILGKQRAAGVVPWWSYLVWAPFHSFTYLCSPNAPCTHSSPTCTEPRPRCTHRYTYFHTLHSEAHGTPVATEAAALAESGGA